jgi:UDP-glucose 4-epimerase
MAKCLVLGANGFIGSHVVDLLVEAGHQVRCFDRFGNGYSAFKQHKNIQIFKGDFLNRNDLADALSGMQYVFHFISTTTPITAENDPLIDVDTNIRMSIQLFQECAAKKIKKVIFASTGGSVYGCNTGQPVPETFLPQPFSPYAIGKLTIEHYLRYFERKFGLKSVVYRISNPYGARQPLGNKQGVIPIFLQRIAANEPITILGNGSMVRDYIYVEDVARMLVGSFEKAKQEVYNLGSGQGASVNELVKIIRKTVDRKVRTKKKPKPVTFVDHIVLDTTPFQTEFKMPPKIKLEQGIQKTWKYILSR